MEEIVEQKIGDKSFLYKIINGTAYHVETDCRIISVLENCRKSGERIRIYYGDTSTGRDWLEEYDTMGTIGRSMGKIKIPLLIFNSRSFGGSALSMYNIVKIQNTKTKQILYKHSLYHTGEITIHECDQELQKAGYIAGVSVDGKNHANFKKENQVERYVDFMKGNRMAK